MNKIEAVPLQEWANRHEPDKKMHFYGAYWPQITLVRDDISAVLACTYDEYTVIKGEIKVIGEHRSKSVTLPVFRLTIGNRFEITMRFNFYDWKVSIKSNEPVVADFMGLFDPAQQVEATCCEGFPDDCIYGPYTENNQRFTFEVRNNNDLYVFFWIFSHLVLNNRNKCGTGR